MCLQAGRRTARQHSRRSRHSRQTPARPLANGGMPYWHAQGSQNGVGPGSGKRVAVRRTGHWPVDNGSISHLWRVDQRRGIGAANRADVADGEGPAADVGLQGSQMGEAAAECVPRVQPHPLFCCSAACAHPPIGHICNKCPGANKQQCTRQTFKMPLQALAQGWLCNMPTTCHPAHTYMPAPTELPAPAAPARGGWRRPRPEAAPAQPQSPAPSCSAGEDTRYISEH